MKKAVFIHAGAHRTGTSSFQACLSENRGCLDALGYDLAYPGRDGVPGGSLRLRLPRPRHGEKRIPEFAAGVRNRLAELSPDPSRRLILSEENLAGPMHHLYEGRFFPAARKRFRTLAAALDAPPDHLVFVVRSYADLYVSAHRKRAEDNAVAPFCELVPHFMAMDRGWPGLLADLRDHLKPARLTVLAYEGRGESRALLQTLVPGLASADLAEPAVPMNQSATDAALDAVQSRYHAGDKLRRREWRTILNDHSHETASTGFAAFPDRERALLEDLYHADLARLSGMGGITFRRHVPLP
ncbi:hypothetical protein QO034_08130 [Sedimentitalea sp. JM2-8]|uniref:Sulfotransferase family protein n=1 Tax=Sedimentitalea xiamensis TaxID=3050037 RepID=A0ABT7FD76_9RHOB|nr:hypothetical protein [Sedimentitalea xiamensis]MDK3073072.1 hypothetical protein [Sedimentitalea xiamensis]